MTKVVLSLWNILSYYTKRLFKWTNQSLPILLEELKRLTPENEWEMLNSYVVEEPKINWLRVIWSITNTAAHSIYVEFWRNIKWLENEYHKPKWNVFYKWIGNRTFARATDNVKGKIDWKILEIINS